MYNLFIYYFFIVYSTKFRFTHFDSVYVMLYLPYIVYKRKEDYNYFKGFSMFTLTIIMLIQCSHQTANSIIIKSSCLAATEETQCLIQLLLSLPVLPPLRKLNV